jgi:hypothetical protein
MLRRLRRTDGPDQHERAWVASTNKCLAPSNKSCTGGKATKKRRSLPAQIFGEDKQVSGRRPKRLTKHSALRDAAGRKGPNSTSIRSADLPWPVNGCPAAAEKSSGKAC